MPAPAHTQAAAPGERDPALDGLRGVAILLVFVFHYGGGLRSHNPLVRGFGYLTQVGWVGVELFFVLSGFLITGLLWNNLDQPQGWRNFVARRALRIMPVYLAALLIAGTAALAAGASLQQLRPLLLYLAFLQNIPPLVHAALHYPPPLPLNHLWTLAVEEQFYLVWPLALVLVRSRRQALRASVAVFGGACLFRGILFWPGRSPLQDLDIWAPSLGTRIGALALGGALALYGRHPARTAAYGLWFGGLAGFLLNSLHGRTLLLSSGKQFTVGLPCVELACAGAVAAALHPGLWRAVLHTAPLRFFGRISYGFYVLHVLLEPVFDRIGQWPVHRSSGMAYLVNRFVFAFLVTTLAATLSFRYFEQPVLRWKRFFPRRSPSFV